MKNNFFLITTILLHVFIKRKRGSIIGLLGLQFANNYEFLSIISSIFYYVP